MDNNTDPISIEDYFKVQTKDYQKGYISAVRNFMRAFQNKTKDEMYELCLATERYLNNKINE